MARALKDTVSQWIPRPMLGAARRVYHHHKQNTAMRIAAPYRAILANAPTEPEWLDAALLPELHAAFPPQPPSPVSNAERLRLSRQRVHKLFAFLGRGTEGLNDFLEIGCGRGHTAFVMHEGGKRVVGTDFAPDSFEPEMLAAGVDLRAMDAMALELEDASFDCVYSYGALEHIPDPGKAYGEALRVLRPGGYFFAHIGPLYMSPLGRHAYRTTNVPYVQHLFTPDALETFARDVSEPNDPELKMLAANYVNGVRLAEYRRAWNEYADRVDTIVYLENPDTRYVEMIGKYPSCFRSKSADLEEFLVAFIEILVRKK